MCLMGLPVGRTRCLPSQDPEHYNWLDPSRLHVCVPTALHTPSHVAATSGLASSAAGLPSHRTRPLPST